MPEASFPYADVAFLPHAREAYGIAARGVKHKAVRGRPFETTNQSRLTLMRRTAVCLSVHWLD